MVRLSRYTAGASDGYMNEFLSHEQRTMFLHAYNAYDKKASAMLTRAVREVYKRYMRGESFDVVPLCVATLLYAAAVVSHTQFKQHCEATDHMKLRRV